MGKRQEQRHCCQWQAEVGSCDWETVQEQSWRAGKAGRLECVSTLPNIGGNILFYFLGQGQCKGVKYAKS